jgi:uncharacterized protein YegL
MRRDLTEVVVVLDCSGSMKVCKSNIEQGLNDFLRKQKEVPGKARITVVNFSDSYNIRTVVNGLDIKDVNSISLNPAGQTALLDAIGQTVDSVGQKLAETPEEDRPGLVTVAIVTDGLENDSRRYNKEQIREKLKHQTEKYNWNFAFIGANQDAVLTATDYGLPASSALNYNTNSQGWAKGLIGNVTRGRLANSLGVDYETQYSDAEVKAAVA